MHATCLSPSARHFRFFFFPFSTFSHFIWECEEREGNKHKKQVYSCIPSSLYPYCLLYTVYTYTESYKHEEMGMANDSQPFIKPNLWVFKVYPLCSQCSFPFWIFLGVPFTFKFPSLHLILISLYTHTLARCGIYSHPRSSLYICMLSLH